MKDSDIKQIGAAVEAVNKFMKEYPDVTSADMQAFIKGWFAAFNYINNE